ncbi:LysE/ArgO family amino acid transporter [Microbacterium sp. No. 7]|uniref:LysE/ArgO family amino acid transporter n=1 Tax=Microbacterium sp. No. 7 TaxID=1714373 RepID=UPI0006ED13DA|nr:LysE/ArgO family amino acid transporter [Microbacterium sp. No. 7]ALJ21303.1 amino acid transporter [Microbacterium sp. No. 7]
MNWTVAAADPTVDGVLTSALAGLGLGLSLIVAIGAQNLFVLRQGMRREHALTVAAVCALSDAALIVAGVSGLGALLQAVPWLVDAVRWAGAAFLTGYAVLAARRALRPTGESLRVADEDQRGDGEGRSSGADPRTAGVHAPTRDAVVLPARTPDAGTAPAVPTTPTAVPTTPATATTAPRSRRAAVVLTCLALTWLNPHVYLDTVFLLGSVASTHGDGRWWFAAGAVVASVAWFFSLAVGARFLGRWLGTPRAWRVLDGVIAVVMLAIAVSLVLPH